MNIGRRQHFVRNEAELLAILLWRDLWVMETEIRGQGEPAWDAIDTKLLEVRAQLRDLMTAKDRAEVDAVMASPPHW